VRTRAERLCLLLALLAGAPARAFDVPGVPGRWSVGGYGEGLAVFPTEHATQRQRPEGILDLKVTGDVHPKLRFFLDTRTVFGGPPVHAQGIGLYNPSDTFQNVSPSVEIAEAYADLYLPRLDVRVGQQKFAWGRLDELQPTDVLNPRQWSDPFLLDEEDAKIGVPALRAAYYPEHVPPRLATDTSLTFVWVPVPIAFRFPLVAERWFPSSIVPQRLDIPRGAAAPGLPPFGIAITPRLRTENRPPAQQLDEGAVALRLAGVHEPVDWSLVYYDGPETAPAFDVSTVTFAPDPKNLAVLATDQVLRPRAGRIRLAGADAATQLAGFTLRAEGAWAQDRLLPRAVSDLTTLANILHALGGIKGATQTLVRLGQGRHVPIDLGPLFLARDTVAWGVGADYRWHGWMPLVQVNQTLVLDNAVPLLVDDHDTSLLASLERTFLAETLKLRISCIQGIVRSYTSLLPALTYDVTDDLRVRVGYLFLAGTRRSLIGEFHDDSESFVQLRYSY